MSSRSSISKSKLVLLVLLACVGLAHAGGRKRIVVLDFEGPKADRFHDDLVRLIKRQHTVVPTDKWNGAAEELDAAKITEKNVKKVAHKLKIDGIVTGKIEKRRDEYIIQIKLRAGTTGEMVGQRVDTKSDAPRLDSKAQRDLKDELLASIEDLESNHGGGASDDDDDSDSKPAKKKHEHEAVAKNDDDGGGDDDSDAKPTKKKKHEKAHEKPSDDDDSASDDSAPKRRPFSKKFDKGADKSDDDTAAALSTKHDDSHDKPKHDDDSASDDSASSDDDDGSKKKKVAKKDDDSDGGDASAEADVEPAVDQSEALSISQRALDATVGMSLLLTRRLSYDSASGLTGSQVPPHYGSTPAPGAAFDVTAYPLAWGHKRQGPLTGLGVELSYDTVLKINSQKAYGPQGMQKVADLQTAASDFQLAAVFRYPLGKGANAPIVGGRLGYGTRRFTIAQTTPDMMSTDLPNVHYSMIFPGAFFRYPAIPKLVIGGEADYLLVSTAGTASGDMSNMAYYGPASLSGYRLEGNADYQLTPKIFARAVIGVESISMTFSNDMTKAGTQVFNRDTNPATQDVSGAHDLYFSMVALIGFAY